jgi:hypothetical protein
MYLASRYDVASFLNYRVVCSGELVRVFYTYYIFIVGYVNTQPDEGFESCFAIQEVRVRFAGFRNTDDEWVNVRRAVRERSIPLESSECQRVKVGDLVLCFQVPFINLFKKSKNKFSEKLWNRTCWLNKYTISSLC